MKKAKDSGGRAKPRHFRWSAAIAPQEWAVYSAAIKAMRNSGLDFLLGGGFALATYTGRWRDTKDLDFYVRPQDREKAVSALTEAGFDDYYERLPYDRKWIYRGVRENVLVDIIWAMANQRAQVDELWFRGANVVTIRGEQLRVAPQEEMMWCKLYIVQHDHCDWIDVFNLLYATGPSLDWDHLIERLEEDAPLLRALLNVYAWLCPRSVTKLPRRLWNRLSMRPPKPPRHRAKRDHIRLLDTRDWFAPLLRKGQKREI